MEEKKKSSRVGKKKRTKEQIALDISLGKKVCIGCGEVKVFNEFRKFNISPDGRNNLCKDCVSLRDNGRPRTHSIRSSEEIEYDNNVGSKVCTVCKIRKEFSEFYKRHQGGYTHNCKACNGIRTSEYRIKSYGISLEEYKEMKIRQKNRCIGCGSKGTTMSPLHIDHDHKTGEVRGLLCGNCNRAIGLLKEDPKTLRTLADFLEGKTVRAFVSSAI